MAMAISPQNYPFVMRYTGETLKAIGRPNSQLTDVQRIFMARLACQRLIAVLDGDAELVEEIQKKGDAYIDYIDDAWLDFRDAN